MYKECLSAAVIGVLLSTDLRAGPEACSSSGGPTVCVRFDNLGTTPQATLDYDFNFSNPQAPNIDLKRGDDGQTMYEWRVWSKDAQGAAAAIGDITALNEYNYSVKILSPSDSVGAVGVHGINLSPSGGRYSDIVDGYIGGSLAGDVTLVADSAGNHGTLNLLLVGDFSGDLNVPTIDTVTLDGLVSGTISTRLVVNGLNMGPTSGQIDIDKIDTNGFVAMDTVSDSLNVDELNGLLVLSGSSEGSLVTLDAMGSAATAVLGTISGPGTNVRGTVQFQQGIPVGATAQFNSKLGSTGTVDMNNRGVAGSLQVRAGGDGTVINGGTIDGIVNLGSEDFYEKKFMGVAEFAGASSTATVTLNGLGDVSFSGTFDGDICGFDFIVRTCLGGPDAGVICSLNEDCRESNNCTSAVILPGNVTIDTRGPNMTVCDTQCSSTNYAMQADATGINKSRFLSFSTAISPDNTLTAIRVAMKSLHHVDPPYTDGPSVPFTALEGEVRWVGPPMQYIESLANPVPFYAAQTQCTPYYHNWDTVGLLHVTGSSIVPSSVYDVQIVPETGTSCSGRIEVQTTRWTDVEIPFNPTGIQPDFGDVSALVNKFRNVASAPIKVRCMLAGIDAYGNVNLAIDVDFTHISACVDAFKGKPYPYELQACP